VQKWEYAVLEWEGDSVGLRRALLFSHAPKIDKPGGTLAHMLATLGDEGWEAVSMVATARANGILPFPVYAMFKRPAG